MLLNVKCSHVLASVTETPSFQDKLCLIQCCPYLPSTHTSMQISVCEKVLFFEILPYIIDNRY